MSLRAPSAASLESFAAAKRDAIKKKRLSSGKPLQDVTGNSNIILNDDESEKARLRAEKARAAEESHAKKNEPVASVMNKRKSLGGAKSALPPIPTSLAVLPPVAPVKPMDLKALNTMFTDCLKLATANKITTKNTWQLDFISHMDRCLIKGCSRKRRRQASAGIFDANGDYDDHSNENQFQKASVGRPEQWRSRMEEDEEENEGGAEDQPKKKKARKTGLSTLEANPAKLDTRLLETEVEIDPLFHLTTAKFEGGATGMLMNNLNIYTGVRLCLDSTEESLLAARPCAQESQQEQEAQLKLNLDLGEFEAQIAQRLAHLGSSLGELRVAPAVDYFVDLKAELVAGGDGSQVEKAQLAAEAGRKKGKKATPVATATAAPAPVEIDLPAVAMSPLPPLELDAQEFGQAGFDQDDEENEIENSPFMGLVAQEVRQLDHAIALEEKLNRSMEHAAEDEGTEMAEEKEEEAQSVSAAPARKRAAPVEEEDAIGYGLLDGLEDLKVNWAGLKHWKFKAAKGQAAKGALNSKGKKKRVVKSKEILDFASVSFAAVSVAKPVTDAAKKALTSPYPSLAGERKIRQGELALPEDRFYRLRNLQTLCQKQNVMVKLRRPGAASSSNSRVSGDMRVVNPESKEQEASGSVSSHSPSVPHTPLREATLQIIPVSSRISPFSRPGDVALAEQPEDAQANVLQFADADGGNDDDDENEPAGGGEFGADGSMDDEDANPYGGPSAQLALIAEPVRAGKTSIEYARVSTTVDVKALKAAMWKGVEETMEQRKVEGVEYNQTTFQRAINTVPENFPARVAHQLPSISVSYCFISMLHLCNEHGLSLVAPGANPDAESANRVSDIEAASRNHREFVKDTAHVKLIGEKKPEPYYVGDFLVRSK